MSDDTGVLSGGLIAGPLVMGNLPDTLEELPDPGIAERVSSLPVFTTRCV